MNYKNISFAVAAAFLVAGSAQVLAESHSPKKQKHNAAQQGQMKKGDHTGLPFALKSYGHFQKMMHMKKTDGVVKINHAIKGPHIFAVGAPEHGTGEITVVDGKLWLDYGKDGLGNAIHVASADETAVILVKATVKKWKSIVVPQDMDATSLHKFILAQAGSGGLAITKPFPFLIQGNYFDLHWHILNGLKTKGGGHGAGGLFKKIKETRAKTSGTVVGFYSAASQGVFTHPDESWHLHVVFENEGKAGHVDEISVRKGAILKLPVE